MPGFIRSFVKRRRKLSKAKADLLENLMPQVEASAEKLKPIPDSTPINMEIGFGSGNFLETTATRHPEEIFIGCDPYLQGIINLLSAIKNKALQNILLWNDDARILLEEIPDNILSNVFILFPDPWPKARHHKRRIINKLLLDLLSKKIKAGGHLYIATDHADYKEWILEVLDSHDRFSANTSDSWKKELFKDIETCYQRKAKDQNIDSSFMCFILSK